MKWSHLIIGLFVSGCAYNAPIQPQLVNNKATLSLPYDQVWKATLQQLIEGGHQIKTSSREDGYISTEKALIRLAPDQADCGNILGIPYLKDDRTITHVSYGIALKSRSAQTTDITVATSIDAEFNATSNSGTKHLSCFSTGFLEKGLIDKIGK